MKKVKWTIIITFACILCACGNANDLNTNNKTESSSEILAEKDTEVREETQIEEVSSEDDSVVTEEQEKKETENVSDIQMVMYTYTELNTTMYAKSSVNVRNLPSTNGEKVGALSKAQAVVVTGLCNETGWYRINYGGNVAYVSNKYLIDTEPETQVTPTPPIESNTELIPEQEPTSEPESSVQPSPDVQLPGPDSDNIFNNPNTNYYEENMVVVRPKYAYWNSGNLYMECYVINGCSYTVSGIEVETLSFANDNGEFATANFGELMGITIPPYSHIIWTFVFTDEAILVPNADLNNLYYYSNIYYY